MLTDGELAGFQVFIKLAFARKLAVRSLLPSPTVMIAGNNVYVRRNRWIKI
jgi:hypothetical protein